ncbi:MAG: HAMP domain-containing sensor histidine kinase [Pseudomonadota bacterium]
MDLQRLADEQLTALAAHLHARRAAILQSWRNLVDADVELHSAAALPRTQFNDHIPELLDAYERGLHRWPRAESAASGEDRKEDSAKHGLLRWQQGYLLREVTLEWGHLQLCLVAELESYFIANPHLEPVAMFTAWRALAQLCSEGVNESVTKYFQLRQAEAVGHVRDLEHTVRQVRELEGARAELLRQATHDLRGHVGVVRNVTHGLASNAVPEARRDDFIRLLQKSVSSLSSMLEDVMNLARLQAGQDVRETHPMDAAKILKDLAATMEPLAQERGLYLRLSGPLSLEVDGDAIKLARIAQNLLLNALKYTLNGGVTLRWGESRDNDGKRWMLCVEDTGPGFQSGPGAQIVGALKAATQESHDVEHVWTAQPATSSPTAPGAGQEHEPILQVRGEGIGLSIVKRLCDLLDGSVEVDSVLGEGTIFRVVLPRHYEVAPTQP